MQIGFYFDQTRCTGCYTCTVACKDWHDIPAGPASWMRVSTIERGKFPDVFVAFFAQPCYHCAHPACVEVCPVDAAIKRDEDGIVVVDQEKCLGKDKCSACKDACPWGVPQFRAENAKMEKCDLCLERWAEGKKPICVEGCPMYALDAGPMEEMKTKYGTGTQAAGFTWSEKCQPSVVFKPKLK
ncbi:MAG: 4Fe-4S dicluster domain-containing protein [Chloroflexota bacterium]